MKQLPTHSPFDEGQIIVTRFYCPGSDVTVEGQFAVEMPFSQLSPEQLSFVETFVRCEGKLSHMERELGISYPTIRSRLHEVIRALGYEPGKEEEKPEISSDERQSILDDLEAGRISFEDAMARLEGETASADA
ncbi:MAG: DUF2089 domain-containing protein [Litorilinea sp.]